MWTKLNMCVIHDSAIPLQWKQYICLVYMYKNVHSSTVHASKKIIIKQGLETTKKAYQEENG